MKVKVMWVVLVVLVAFDTDGMKKGDNRSVGRPVRVHPSLRIHSDVLGNHPSPPFSDDTFNSFPAFDRQMNL